MHCHAAGRSGRSGADSAPFRGPPPMTGGLLQALAAGEAALERGDLEAAETAFHAAAEAVPHDVGIALALANVHRLRNSLDARREVLERAYATGDRTDHAHRLRPGRGAARVRRGRGGDATAFCM